MKNEKRKSRLKKSRAAAGVWPHILHFAFFFGHFHFSFTAA
jgi:hypothetical protein